MASAYGPSMGYAGQYHGRNLVEVSIQDLRGSMLSNYVERCDILSKNWERGTYTMYEDEFKECCIRKQLQSLKS